MRGGREFSDKSPLDEPSSSESLPPVSGVINPEPSGAVERAVAAAPDDVRCSVVAATAAAIPSPAASALAILTWRVVVPCALRCDVIATAPASAPASACW